MTMDSSTAREIRLRLQQAEELVSELEEESSTLHENGVDTSTSTTLSNKQKELQDELEQITSDVLALLAESDVAGGHKLPNTPRTPVSDGSLPRPAHGDFENPPQWAVGKGSSERNE